MSKTSQKNKEKAAKNKVKDTTVEQPKTKVLNEGKCCSCKYFENNPGFCSKLKNYRARKADVCKENYKVK